jgi:mannose-6-phosphate isomerase-like protein (cupin superfamily)
LLNDHQSTRVQLHVHWRAHRDTDKVFIVLNDELQIDFRDGVVTLGPAGTFVVPKAIEHAQFAANQVRLTLITLRGGRNTGGSGGEHARRNDA